MPAAGDRVHRLLREQRPQPEAHAATLIKQHLGNGELPPPNRISDQDYTRLPRSPRAYGGNPAALFPYFETAMLDGNSQMDSATAQCLACALYRDPGPA